MNRDRLATKLAIKYGLLICVCYVLYFLLLAKLDMITMSLTRSIYPVIFLYIRYSLVQKHQKCSHRQAFQNHCLSNYLLYLRPLSMYWAIDHL